MSDFKVGDTVKVSFEGKVTRVLPFEDTVELRIEPTDGSAQYIYSDAANVEKVEPSVEVFGPGNVVRWVKGYRGGLYTVVDDRRVLSHRHGAISIVPEPIDSTRYERVEVG